MVSVRSQRLLTVFSSDRSDHMETSLKTPADTSYPFYRGLPVSDKHKIKKWSLGSTDTTYALESVLRQLTVLVQQNRCYSNHRKLQLSLEGSSNTKQHFRDTCKTCCVAKVKIVFFARIAPPPPDGFSHFILMMLHSKILPWLYASALYLYRFFDCRFLMHIRSTTHWSTHWQRCYCFGLLWF